MNREGAYRAIFLPSELSATDKFWWRTIFILVSLSTIYITTEMATDKTKRYKYEKGTCREKVRSMGVSRRSEKIVVNIIRMYYMHV